MSGKNDADVGSIFLCIGILVGALGGAYEGFVYAGVGGAIVGVVLGAIGGAIVSSLIVVMLPIGFLILIVAVVIWLVSSLWAAINFQ